MLSASMVDKIVVSAKPDVFVNRLKLWPRKTDDSVTKKNVKMSRSTQGVCGNESMNWKEVSVVQNATYQSSKNTQGQFGPELNASYVFREWRRLDHAALGLDFLGGKSCADVNGCVGVRANDGTTCVCYMSSA